MGPIAYSLCHKPVIGTVMWITSLCSFPALFSDEPISLTSAEASATKAFVVPVDKRYPLAVTFEFESTDARLHDQVVGTRFDENCNGDVRYEEIPENRRDGLGRPIPFKVTVRKAGDGLVVLEQTFTSLCVTSHAGQKKARKIGWLELQRGEYTVEVVNLQAHPGLDRVKTRLSLYAGYGK
jgi:hypothetical protein